MYKGTIRKMYADLKLREFGRNLEQTIPSEAWEQERVETIPDECKGVDSKCCRSAQPLSEDDIVRTW